MSDGPVKRDGLALRPQGGGAIEPAAWPAAKGTRLSWRFILPREDPWAIVMVCVVGLFSLFILSIPVIIIVLSFREGRPIDPVSAYSLMHYASVFTDPVAYRALINTITFSLVTLVVAFVFGLPAAWLVERTNLPAKPLLYTLMTLGILLPGFATAMGWLFMLHPRIGLVNVFFMRVVGFAEALEQVCVDVVESGRMTKDLATLISADQPHLTTDDFMNAIEVELRKRMTR